MWKVLNYILYKAVEKEKVLISTKYVVSLSALRYCLIFEVRLGFFCLCFCFVMRDWVLYEFVFSAYQITFRRNSSNSNAATVDVLSPSARQYTATGLKPELVYVFRLTAQTRKGWGEAAEALVVTTEKRGKHAAAQMYYLICPPLKYVIKFRSDRACVCVCDLQLDPNPRAALLCLKRKSRLAECCCHGNRAATACPRSVTTQSSSESCPTATGPSTLRPSDTRHTPT